MADSAAAEMPKRVEEGEPMGLLPLPALPGRRRYRRPVADAAAAATLTLKLAHHSNTRASRPAAPPLPRSPVLSAEAKGLPGVHALLAGLCCLLQRARAVGGLGLPRRDEGAVRLHGLAVSSEGWLGRQVGRWGGLQSARGSGHTCPMLLWPHPTGPDAPPPPLPHHPSLQHGAHGRAEAAVFSGGIAGQP